MDWFTDVLAESGIDFRHEIDEKHEGDNYEVLDVGHSTQYGEEYSEQLTMDAVLKHAEADGLEVQYEITMVKLEKDGDRVTGLIAKNANDEYVRYNASKGVILACGGYSGNETMMNALQPQSVEQTCVNYSKPGAKATASRRACGWCHHGHHPHLHDLRPWCHQAGPDRRVRQGQRWCPLLDGQPAVLEGEPEG